MKLNFKKKSFKEFINSCKKFIIDNTKLLGKTIKENMILVCYVIGAVLNGMLLRVLTIGFHFRISPILADLLIALIFSCLYFVFKKDRDKFIYLMVITIISFILALANAVYYYYYSSFISVTFISFALTNTETGKSNVVGDLLQIKFFLVLWFPIFMLVMNKIINKRKKKIKKEREVPKKVSLRVLGYLIIIVLFSFLSTLNGVDYGRFNNQWNREYLVSKFGLYLYQINDLVKSVEPKMAAMFGSDKSYKQITDFYNNKEKQSTNEYTNIFKGKNVIAIHAESLQDFVINYSINGTELTPTLNKLSSEGLYFSNFYTQVSFGTSSDTEFTIATSLLPVSSGTVFINYYDRTYISMYQKLQDLGYYTFSMHANTGDFWNRNIMHKNLGYEKFYDKSAYEIDETVGFGLSDRSFMLQSVNKIEKISQEHPNYYGTLITLSNHTPFDYNELFENIDVSMTVDGVKYPYMEGTKLGNYFKSVHYADAQLGTLINTLDEKGLLDNTVIMIYGDHDARISLSNWNRLFNYNYETDSVYESTDKRYKELDYYWQELNRSTPLIIWSKDKNFQNNYSKEVTTVMGMDDVSPTLGNMLGFTNEYALGHDIMNIKDDNLVAFPNGNYVTNYVYYNDNKGEYKLLKDVPLSEDYINSNKEKTKELLDISNKIIIYDYFSKLLSNKEYEVEQ